MENKAKPRICEVLGVGVGEKFTAAYPYKDLGELEIREDGRIICGRGKVRSTALCHMINHPECIHKVCRWTPEEVELAKAIKLMFPNSYSLIRVCDLHEEWIRISSEDGHGISVILETRRFLSLKPGETALLSDIIGGDENA